MRSLAGSERADRSPQGTTLARLALLGAALALLWSPQAFGQAYKLGYLLPWLEILART